MKINKIVLHNIGPYKGTNEFSFDMTNDHNVILIGGKNGSGKTSLLKSIKYGLFGSYCFGSKTFNKKYVDEVSDMLNINPSDENYYIYLYISIAEDGKVNNYKIKRTWSYVQNNLDESFEVEKNNESLNEYDIQDFFERLRALTSPQLINSFIFDGEKIGNIIQNDETQEYLREVFYSIFNINCLDQLNTDLKNYLEKKTSSNIDSKEYTLIKLSGEINLRKNEMKQALTEKNKLQNTLNELNSNIKAIEKQFKSLGGISKAQIKKMSIMVNEYLKLNDVIQRNVKDYYEKDLSLYIIKDLIKNGIEQAQKELPLRYKNYLEQIELFLGKEYKDIHNDILSKVETDTLIHNIDNDSIKKINNRYNNVILNTKRTKVLLSKKDEEDESIAKIKSVLDSNESIERFNSLIQEMGNYQSRISEVMDNITLLSNKIHELQMIIDRLCINYDTINNEIRKSKTFDKSFDFANRAIKINEQFAIKIINSRLEKVSELTLEIFNSTIRKERYIKKIRIDRDFNIHLYDHDNIEKKTKILSAGEIQLLVSSIIWAMFRISGKKEAFVFDTPLARLDAENRNAFVNNIVKTISKQVIILSTDSEIIGGIYEEIKPNICNEYTLDYDESTQSTNILKGYFQ